MACKKNKWTKDAIERTGQGGIGSTIVKTAGKVKNYFKIMPYHEGKFTIPKNAYKPVVGGSLALAAGDAAYRIGKAWYEANKESKKLVDSSIKGGDELIANIRKQRAKKNANKS